MNEWKVGLVGTGWWSEKHLTAWSQIPNVEVAALCNRSRAKLESKAEEYGIPSERLYGSIDDMLADADIHIVDIVTGPETHLEFVTKAAEAGKHIMCQKPFARSVEEAQQMVDVAKRCGVRLMVTENWRWLSRFQKIKEVITEGILGELKMIRYVHTDYYTPRMGPGVTLPQPYFREMPQLLFYEMGVHWFDTWRFLFGDPKRLYAETLSMSPHVVGDDSGIVVLGYEGYYGFLDMSWATRQKLDEPLGDAVGPVHLEQMVVDGSKGTLKLYTDGRIGLVQTEALTETEIVGAHALDHQESHIRLQTHFIEALDADSPFQTSAEDNVKTLRLTFGTYESAKKHHPIFF